MRARALLVLILPGCSTAHHVRGPNGSNDWLSVSCHHDVARCFERAGSECPNGYELANMSSKEGRAFVREGTSGYEVPTFQAHMLIRCHRAP
ncbi:MAG: hypothetical protein M3O36_18135 [Myxococcota bacterium]|nr:hypothetical protein [Myxococcota bacterium]